VTDDGAVTAASECSGVYPFRRLSVWEKAHELTLRVFNATEGAQYRKFPGLVGQLRRAIAAIPANIAEGAGHSTDPQFNRFLEIAVASAHEADYHMLLAKDLQVLSSREYAQLEARLSEVRQMLIGLRKRVMERMRTNGVTKSGRRGVQRSRADMREAERS
jgi:four helix bundle protein